ncbi:MAG: 4a-hydroxytetrahydrobiopterin dehydratase [Firmicutes bacterium]|nr:4a-hydroxytetrahydrobiopterin dehydratase [Bacillota bacterium]
MQYNRVTITTTTHDEGGISDRDIALIRQIEALPSVAASL